MPAATPTLLEALAAGEIDLTLTTEMQTGEGGEALMESPLVWAGASDCRAHALSPLPVSFADKRCAFRSVANRALIKAGLDWRLATEGGNILSVHAAVEADLAVSPMLAAAIPAGMAALPTELGLPPLPVFYVNMYLPKTGGSDIAQELARYIREQFKARYQQAV